MNKDPFYVVALGASAGGHQALWEFFAYLPPLSKAAFVVVQHLKADAPSIADQLLTNYTTMPVSWAQHQQRLQPGHIYLLPPGKYMTLLDGRLQVVDRDPGNKLNQAIDVFFKSLADQQDGHGLGIILSGTGSDGTKGAIYMHQRGGRIWVQDPATAEFTGMPTATIVHDHVSLVCSTRELAQALQALVTTVESPSPRLEQ